ncbi:Hypothetical protein FKW44_024377 [Caligus rogercresseyi]|uniref:Uncharacterized protein n=1 Tax=Caligus rogercresseyi TaxID=217165 RepID=A0A7T8GM47_CALRO|nr:Hypothetical protein FKW44_024377 [Caligus rogercresseyi]
MFRVYYGTYATSSQKKHRGVVLYQPGQRIKNTSHQLENKGAWIPVDNEAFRPEP